MAMNTNQPYPTIFAFHLADSGGVFTTNSHQEGVLAEHGLSRFTTHALTGNLEKYGDRLRSLAVNENVVFVFQNAERDVPKLANLFGMQPGEIRACKVGIDDLAYGLMYKEPLKSLLSDAQKSSYEYSRYCQQLAQNASLGGINLISDGVADPIRSEKAKEEIVQVSLQESNRALARSELLDGVLTDGRSEELFVVFDMLRQANPAVADRHMRLINMNNDRKLGNTSNHLLFSEAAAAKARYDLRSEMKDILNELDDIAERNPSLFVVSENFESKEGTALLLKDLVELNLNLDKQLLYLQNEDMIELSKDLYNKEPTLLGKMREAEDVGLPSGTDIDLHNYIKRLICYRALNQDLQKLKEYTDKFQHIQQDLGFVPTPVQYAKAVTGRNTGSTGGVYNFNSQGMPALVKSVLVPPEGKQLVSIDFSSMEVAVAASITGNQDLLDAYNQGKDIYAAFGLQANLLKQNADTKNSSLSDLFEQVEKMKMEASKNPEAQVAYDEMRSLGKSFVLPKLYGSGSETLAKSKNLTRAEADILLASFDKTFPEVSTISQQFSSSLNTAFQGGGDVIPLPLQQGHQDCQEYGKKVMVLFNDYHHYNQLYGLFSIPLSPDALEYQNEMRRQGLVPALGGRSTLSVYLNSGDRIVYEKSNQVGIKDLYGAKLFQNINQGAAAAVVREFSDVLQQVTKEKGLEVDFVLDIHDEINMLVDQKDAHHLVDLVEQVKEGSLGVDTSRKVLSDIKWRGDVIIAKNLAGDNPEPTPIKTALTHDQSLNLTMEDEMMQLFSFDNHTLNGASKEYKDDIKGVALSTTQLSANLQPQP